MLQVESFEEFEIGQGEIINAVEPLRTWLTLKSGVDRHQNVCMAGERRSQSCDTLWPGPTMQNQDGATVSSFVDADRQTISKRHDARVERRESTHSISSFYEKDHT